jgi:hypothetical protein
MMVPPACYVSLTRASRFDPTAGKFFHNGSPGLLPACYLSLTKASCLDPTAGEFFLAGSPGLMPA